MGETASGAVAIQVMDALFPGKVPMHKVNWGAKADYEFVQNYKVLQSVFDKLKVDKKVDVDKLIRARYQDNLEFMQWLKKFFEINAPQSIEGYDAVSQRNKGKGVNQFKPAQGVKPGATKKVATKRPTATTAPIRSQTNKVPQKENKRAINKTTQDNGSMKRVKELETQVSELTEKVETLTTTNQEMDSEAKGLERERDFYFGKLRDVEILLQNYNGPDENIVRQVLKVLYATDEDADGEGALAAVEAEIEANRQVREAKSSTPEETTENHITEEDAAIL